MIAVAARIAPPEQPRRTTGEAPLNHDRLEFTRCLCGHASMSLQIQRKRSLQERSAGGDRLVIPANGTSAQSGMGRHGAGGVLHALAESPGGVPASPSAIRKGFAGFGLRAGPALSSGFCERRSASCPGGAGGSNQTRPAAFRSPTSHSKCLGWRHNSVSACHLSLICSVSVAGLETDRPGSHGHPPRTTPPCRPFSSIVLAQSRSFRSSDHRIHRFLGLKSGISREIARIGSMKSVIG